MIPIIKLKKDSQVFPQTVDKAVIVKLNNKVTTLDKIIPIIVLGIESDNLEITTNNNIVKVEPKKIVNASEKPIILKIQYDEYGRITQTDEVSRLKTIVNNLDYISYDGNNDSILNFGDDFLINNNKINLTWGNGTS